MAKNRYRVRSWPQLVVRVDPDEDQAFKDKTESNGETRTKAIRKMIRDYIKKD